MWGVDLRGLPDYSFSWSTGTPITFFGFVSGKCRKNMEKTIISRRSPWFPKVAPHRDRSWSRAHSGGYIWAVGDRPKKKRSLVSPWVFPRPTKTWSINVNNLDDNLGRSLHFWKSPGCDLPKKWSSLSMNDSGASASSLVEVWEVEKQGGEKKNTTFLYHLEFYVGLSIPFFRQTTSREHETRPRTYLNESHRIVVWEVSLDWSKDQYMPQKPCLACLITCLFTRIWLCDALCTQ